MNPGSRWQQVSTRRSYDDSEIVGVEWIKPDELCVKLKVVLAINCPGQGAIYFLGVKNRAAIDELLRANPDFAHQPWRDVNGFHRRTPDEYSLGPLQVRAANHYEA